MTQQTQLRRRGSYGIDAPYGFALMAVMTVFFLVLAIISGSWACHAEVESLANSEVTSWCGITHDSSIPRPERDVVHGINREVAFRGEGTDFDEMGALFGF